MMSLEWHTEQRKVEDLVPYSKNPRKITKEDQEKLKDSLEKFNLTEIPGIDIDGILVWGHQRVKILILLDRGKEVIDVRVPNRKLTDEEFRELNVRSNIQAGAWDFDILIKDFSEDVLIGWGMDTDAMPFPENEAPEETTAVPVLSEKPPLIKIGDIFCLGKHILICGDSSTPELLKNIGVDMAALVFTSPPYNMNANWGMYRDYNDDMDSAEYIEFNMQVIENILPYLSGFLFWNISYNKNSRWEFLEIAHRILSHNKLKFLEMVIWDKKSAYPVTSNLMLTRQYEPVFVACTEDAINDLEIFYVAGNRKCYFNKVKGKALTNYWQIPTQGGTHQDSHKACYPVELVRKGIEAMTSVGDTVIDPFIGAGTTLIGCEQTERKCVGIELSPAYCELIVRRYSNYMIQQKKECVFSHLNGDLTLESIIKN